MLSKSYSVFIVLSGATIGLLAGQVYRDQGALDALQRQSATCNWGCPSTLRDHDAESRRAITALAQQLNAVHQEWLSTDPAEFCSLTLVRNAAVEFPRQGPRPLAAEVIDARVYEIALEACVAFRYMHEAHPHNIGYASWAENCAAAGYRSAIPGIPSRMLTPNDPDEEIR
jgi:hypothetical protein